MAYCYRCMSPISENDKICPFCGKQTDIGVPLHHLLPGTVLNNKFLVGTALGEGGFGITYLGRDLLLDMKVAIKEYYPTGYVNRSNTVSAALSCGTEGERLDFFEKGRERFLKEARTLAKFAGERGIVCVRDFFEVNNTAYIVMEYLDGITLKQYLKDNGKMRIAEVINLLKPMMHSLSRIHKENLIHRDISPDNIMIVNGEPKLLDFGAARSVSAASQQSLSVMLKPGYAPEEQYRSKGEQGPWTDVYALCATIYKCITGITPDDATQRLYQDELKKPSELGVQIDNKTEAVLMKGMSVLHTDRYKTVDEMLSELDGSESEPEYVPDEGSNPTVAITSLSNVGDSTVLLQNNPNMNRENPGPQVKDIGKNNNRPSNSVHNNVVREDVSKDNGKGKKTGLIIGCAAAALVLIGVVLFFVLGSSGDKEKDSDNRITETTGKEETKTEEETKSEATKSEEETKPEATKTEIENKPEESEQGDENTDNNPEPTTEDNTSEKDYIRLNTEIKDSLTDKNDRKVYRFKLENPGVLWLTTTTEMLGDEAYYWDSRLYNEDDVMMTEVRISGVTGGPKNHRNIGLPAGEYYLVNCAGDAFSDTEYSMIINFDDHDAWEQEFNDSKNTANIIETGKEIHGSVMSEADQDWYRFEVDKTCSIVIAFGNKKTDKAKNYWNACIYNEYNKKVLGADFHGMVEGYENSESISLDPGTYYLCVTQGESYSVYEYFFVLNKLVKK